MQATTDASAFAGAKSLKKKVMASQRQVIKAWLQENETKLSYLVDHYSFHDLSLQCQNFLFKESASYVLRKRKYLI